jgi:tRNA pseudouridine38-40 synthase
LAEVRNVQLTLEYDGTSFHGWEASPGVRSVKGVLIEALASFLGAPPDLAGASRTDAGVHALGQVASFQARLPFPVARLPRVLNDALPPDVRVRAAEEQPGDFHARFSATGKHYRYWLARGAVASAFGNRYALHYPWRLDLDAMREAAAFFPGERDFASFQCASKTTRETTIRTVYQVGIFEWGEHLAFDVTGRSFLYRMVRCMVGTLLEVGRGKWAPRRVAEALAGRSRAGAGPTAPAHGLFLIGVAYRAPPAAPVPGPPLCPPPGAS